MIKCVYYSFHQHAAGCGLVMVPVVLESEKVVVVCCGWLVRLIGWCFLLSDTYMENADILIVKMSH